MSQQRISRIRSDIKDVDARGGFKEITQQLFKIYIVMAALSIKNNGMILP
jgi:hypothetical protein